MFIGTVSLFFVHFWISGVEFQSILCCSCCCVHVVAFSQNFRDLFFSSFAFTDVKVLPLISSDVIVIMILYYYERLQ